MRRIVAVLSAVLAVAGLASGAESASTLRASGYLNLQYSFVGSAASETTLSAMYLTGSLRLSTRSQRFSLVYRSHHWIDFRHTEGSLYGDPFSDRHVLHTVYLEGKDVFGRGLNLRLGRFFPAVESAALTVNDGGMLEWKRGKFGLSVAAGKPVDIWNGSADSGEWQAAAGLRFCSGNLRWAWSFAYGTYWQIRRSELASQFSLQLENSVWADVQAAFDFESRELARASFGFSWRNDQVHLSLAASEWRNPFEQLVADSRTQELPYWGYESEPVPSIYRDIRFSASWRAKRLRWSWRGMLGRLAGVRSGWLGNIFFQGPAFFGLGWSLGGQVLDSDYIRLLSLDAAVTYQRGPWAFQLLSQSRLYQWQPRPSAFRNVDNYVELQAEYPPAPHLYLRVAAGLFIRKLGDERLKERLQLQFIYRM